MNKNLVDLNTLKNIAVKKDINKFIVDYGYSNRKNKKYYIKNINGKIIHFGDIRYPDNLVDPNEKRKQKFISRWINKVRPDINSPLFYSFYLLW